MLHPIHLSRKLTMRIEKCLAIPAKCTRLPPLEFMNSNPSRQIILPFDLRKDRSALSDKSDQNFLWDVFPGIVDIMFGTYSITFVFETHLPPPLPLPQKVAGLACRITDNFKWLWTGSADGSSWSIEG